jgi:hypothetical protein
MTKSITVIDAPSILGLRPTGVELLPDAPLSVPACSRVCMRVTQNASI